MKIPSFAVDLKAFSFWYKVGIIGAGLISLYLIGIKCAHTELYPFLEDPRTINFFKSSKTIVIVQNDDNLKNKIREVYQEKVIFCTAKDKSELTQEVEALCNEGKNIIVVNEDSLPVNESSKTKSLDPLPDLAEKLKYSLYITNSTTQVPIYAAWLLSEANSSKLLLKGNATLKNLLETVPQFSSSFKSFSHQSSIEDMLKYYQLAASNKNGMLHCTAKYLGRGSVPGSKTYWEDPVIKRNVGRSYDIHVIGFVMTPRTFGARVKLTKDELELWGNDEFRTIPTNRIDKDDDKPDFAPVKGRGSRAHITLGVANGVQAVVTGQDLLEIVGLEAVEQEWPTYKCKDGWLRDYGKGRWVFYLDEKTSVSTLFDGVYGF